ncbi:MAG TPA: hypothetical protein VLE96_03265 [Chlamydiales bacterium]|nr:hypothetical protein [Chlamydiales bacterium]
MFVIGEPSQKKLRFFNLDCHISVIADVKQILESFGHEVVDWSISGHTWVFDRNRNSVEVVNHTTWADMDQDMCNRFYARYGKFLSQFDAFIVTHTPSFSLLYQKLNKPILIVNSTRYEHPFLAYPNKLEWLNNYLKDGVARNKIFVVSNNKADQAYLKHYTGIESEWIPNLCAYTNAKYTGNTEGFIFHTQNDFMLPILTDLWGKTPLIQNANLPERYRWPKLYDFKGIVHFPYQVSIMSLFEQYTANVPLFFPSKDFMRALRGMYSGRILSAISYYYLYSVAPPNVPGDLNHTYDPQVLNFWLDSADFYDEENMPYIQYFDSYDHLKTLLETVDCQAISKKMAEHNVKRREMIFKKWEKVIQNIISLNNL